MDKRLTHSEAGKLGAAASRDICKRQKLERIAAYGQDPKICQQCQQAIPYESRRNRFCCRSCAMSYNNRGVRRHGLPRAKFCIQCGADMSGHCGKRYCSRICCRAYLRAKKDREILADPNAANPRALRKLLIKFRGHRCESCNLTHWLDQPIPLEQDHINGDSSDNSPENLRLICPNCHALTPTYKGRNPRGSGRAKRRERYRQGKSY